MVYKLQNPLPRHFSQQRISCPLTLPLSVFSSKNDTFVERQDIRDQGLSSAVFLLLSSSFPFFNHRRRGSRPPAPGVVFLLFPSSFLCTGKTGIPRKCWASQGRRGKVCRKLFWLYESFRRASGYKKKPHAVMAQGS